MILILPVMSGVCPIIAMLFIMREYRNSGRALFCAVLFGFAASAALFGYVADQGNDIYRHIYNLRYYTGKSFFQIFNAGPLKTVYIWDIWQWIIANLHNDYLLQSSGAFVGYTIAAYMIFDYAKQMELQESEWRTSIVLAILSISPLTLAIGIRSGNALLICALGIYLYFVRHKNYFLTFAILFLSIFLHNSTLILLAIWILYPVFKRKMLLGAVLVVAVLFTYTNYKAYINLFIGEGSVFESIGVNLQQFVLAYTGNRLNSVHNTVTVGVQTVLVTLLFIRGGGIRQLSLIRNHEEMNEKSGGINEFQILLLVTVYSLVALLAYNGNRYYLVALVLSLVSVMDSFTEEPFLQVKRVLLLDILILILAFMTFIICLNDMNWGTGSVRSFFISLFTGFFSRLLV